jgi:ribosomal peptide maturation radical SAM protein 1
MSSGREASRRDVGLRAREVAIDASSTFAVSQTEFPVALVAMPFFPTHNPSIQIALLRSIAASRGYRAVSYHLNLELAHQIGPEVFHAVAQARGHLLGEWLFARAAFGVASPDPEDRFLDLQSPRDDRRLEGLAVTRERLREIRHQEVPRFLVRMLDEIPWGDYRVVGFTSTFQQNTASFALAAAIKRRYPHVCTVFGGANFEVGMGQELTRTIDCIDYAVIGEGDVTFPELLDALREGRDPAEVPGVVMRREGVVTALTPRPPFAELDELPTPDYTEYFERASRLGLSSSDEHDTLGLPYENSRGCWWGQKHLCTFCGMNLHSIRYRSKSPDRVLAEMTELTTRYPSVHLEAVDNILDMSYFRTLFPRLAQSATRPKLFFEVKANLTRAQIQLLKEAGVIGLQPGIESLHSHVLRLMRKGTTARQNVNTMRWARFHGLEVVWNLLWGFPGETAEDYRELSALLPLLHHLEPPGGTGRLWMARFSPVFNETATFPTTFRRPDPSYAHVYPRDVDVEKVAYFFDYHFVGRLSDTAYEETARQVEAWRAAWKGEQRPRFHFRAYPGFVELDDRRRPSEPAFHVLEGPQGQVYLACSDHARTAAAVAAHLEMPAAEVTPLLDDLSDRGLMMRDGSSYLSLAIPAVGRRYAERESRVYLSLVS